MIWSHTDFFRVYLIFDVPLRMTCFRPLEHFNAVTNERSFKRFNPSTNEQPLQRFSVQRFNE